MDKASKFKKGPYSKEQLHPCSRLIVIFEKLLLNDGITTTQIMEIDHKGHTTSENERNFVCDMASNYILPGYSLICFKKTEEKDLPNPSIFRLVPTTKDTRTTIPKDIQEKEKKRIKAEREGGKVRTEYAQRYRVLYEYLLVLSGYKLSKADFCNIFHADEDTIASDITCINRGLDYLNDEYDTRVYFEASGTNKHYIITGK